MVDPSILITQFLRIDDPLNKLIHAPALLNPRGLTQSIYTSELPEEFDPNASGPGVVVAARGGTSNAELSQIITRRYQVTVWDGVNQYKRAMAAYNALYDWAHTKDNVTIANVGTLISFNEIVPPQELTDPDTEWAMVVAFYELIARS